MCKKQAVDEVLNLNTAEVALAGGDFEVTKELGSSCFWTLEKAIRIVICYEITRRVGRSPWVRLRYGLYTSFFSPPSFTPI